MWNICEEGWWTVTTTVLPSATAYLFNEDIKLYAEWESKPEVGSYNRKDERVSIKTEIF